MSQDFNGKVTADSFVPNGFNVPSEPGLYKKQEDVLGVHGETHFDDYIQQKVGWNDLTSSINTAGVASQNAPISRAFGPVATPQPEERVFAVNDYVFCDPFHINHDIAPGGEGYLHVHWCTDGVDTGNVKWEFSIQRALGHDQANFGAPTKVFVEQAAAGTAWRHMIAEVAPEDACTLTEPDELLKVTLRRVAASSNECTDDVFGVTVDMHYQTDRKSTLNKAPNFYGD